MRDIEQFGTVPLVTVKEALTSPKKRRISVEGTVDEVAIYTIIVNYMGFVIFTSFLNILLSFINDDC